jgi:two-component system, NarL family, nitrate/nitrite response regulator NarL
MTAAASPATLNTQEADNRGPFEDAIMAADTVAPAGPSQLPDLRRGWRPGRGPHVRASGQPGSPAPASSNAARCATCDTGPMPTRVLIVDDNQPFLEAARVLLERQGLSVVGVALTGAEALRRARELQPDLALVDIMLAEESGFECARDLIEHDRDGGPAVILISTHAEADFADLIAESPARGFLPKSDLSADAIRRILNGRPR